MKSWLIIKPDKTQVIRQGESKFHAIAILVMEDNFKWPNWKYKGKSIKENKTITVIKKPIRWL